MWQFVFNHEFFFSVIGFLRKVYGILTAQLTLTVIVAAIFMYSEGIKGFVQSRWMYNIVRGHSK